MKFDVILADPPWHYKDSANSGKRGAVHKYNLMSNEEIEEMDIQSISKDDCILFLWATMPNLPSALEIMKAWGFQYKTVAFTWVKTPKNKKPQILVKIDEIKERIQKAGRKKAINIPLNDKIKFHWGMGNYSRACVELVLLGVKGKPKRVDAGVHQVVLSEVRRHSQKPEEVHRRIERLMGNDVDKVELFARNKVDGWTTIGDHLDEKHINQSIEELKEKENEEEC